MDIMVKAWLSILLVPILFNTALYAIAKTISAAMNRRGQE